MERFFRSLKNEWVPATGYVSFSDAAHAITDYIVGYYSALSFCVQLLTVLSKSVETSTPVAWDWPFIIIIGVGIVVVGGYLMFGISYFFVCVLMVRS